MRLFVIAILICTANAEGGLLLDKVSRRLFEKHQFISLIQRLNEQGRHFEEHWVKDQAQLFKGCQSVQREQGGVLAVQSCMKYLNELSDCNINVEAYRSFHDDVDRLCSKYSSEININKKYHSWPRCSQGLWRQVYLTAYANIDANPILSRSIYRQAVKNLAPNPLWNGRLTQLLNNN